MKNYLTSLTTLILSAALHALLLVVLFTNFPALGEEAPKKPDEPRLIVIATILPEKKIETPEPPKPIPPKNKSPEPKKQKTPTPVPTPAKTRTQTPVAASALTAPVPTPVATPTAVTPTPPASKPRPAQNAIASLANVKIVSRVKPQYPQIARKRNEEGTVVLLARVQGGRVASVSVEKSSGVGTLDASAKSAVEKWKFSPDTNATVRVPVSFSLKE